ncbi:MAG TPA: PDZ domain-containing protein, partial [Rubrobacteraceae bacterium]|nr:PDZ domain-containing protein [Rubrobacteraceae bacterium]
MWEDTAKKADRRHARMRRAILYLVVVMLVLAAYLYGRSQSPAGISAEDRESLTLLAEALDLVTDKYMNQEAVDPKEQTYGAIKGMIDSLDDEGHTRFVTPEEAEEVEENISGEYVGVGIQLDEKDDEVVVSAPIDDSPAEEAGIKPRDVLVAVDGESVQGEEMEEVAKKVRGPEGSRVELTVLRDKEEREFSLERAELELPAASWSLIPGTDVAHLRLMSFSEKSAEALEGGISEARAAGAKRFILDLRNNTGGLLDQARKIAAQFLPAGSEIYTR